MADVSPTSSNVEEIRLFHAQILHRCSDARIIMSDDEGALLRLWQEKRGEVEPEDLSGNLIVQLGVATEDLNRRWYEANTGQVITDIQKQVRQPALKWTAATLDGHAIVFLGGSGGREIHAAVGATICRSARSQPLASSSAVSRVAETPSPPFFSSMNSTPTGNHL